MELLNSVSIFIILAVLFMFSMEISKSLSRYVNSMPNFGRSGVDIRLN